MLSYFADLQRHLDREGPARWAGQLPAQISAGFDPRRHGHLDGWRRALLALPPATPSDLDLRGGVAIGRRRDIGEPAHRRMLDALRALIPWRKGPFDLFGIEIDSEWRSDWKWRRLLPHIQPLAGRRVLDVGCGNGYHCLRAFGARASRVIGIDPSPHFVIQFLVFKGYLGAIPVDVLPMGLESLPADLHLFDTTFSMGVLYHRRCPRTHLQALRKTLVTGGELVLETLVIDGEDGACLIPNGRYAKMPNVWSIPSPATLTRWVADCGFSAVRCVDINVTSTAEQRTTPWMPRQSLRDFLDPGDPGKTLEGHPAPKRALFLATAV